MCYISGERQNHDVSSGFLDQGTNFTTCRNRKAPGWPLIRATSESDPPDAYGICAPPAGWPKVRPDLMRHALGEVSA